MSAPIYTRRIVREAIRDWLVKMKLVKGAPAVLDLMTDDLMADIGLTFAFEMVLTERAVQQAKGYDATHDDEHTHGELTLAALEYARHAYEQDGSVRTGQPLTRPAPSSWWPFRACDWHPRDTAKANLIVAAAMLIADAERLERAEATPISQPQLDLNLNLERPRP
ncbi:hypothetical protein [Prosthecobacter dejongeii]|uniref:Uncharacterized protein n=1 Tax=Prosthecobacter dejongeii TaxID=48465 RepID=A0A7W8DQ13_9BACT|nr:hypothetical protein [Prosthecobacter dejongeii]MBB5038239.1 hypothetical protein [Prosthecobacter dejongeii]